MSHKGVTIERMVKAVILLAVPTAVSQPVTVVCMADTFFQVTGRKVQSLVLSLSRKAAIGLLVGICLSVA